jgi:hypothetical protein
MCRPSHKHPSEAGYTEPVVAKLQPNTRGDDIDPKEKPMLFPKHLLILSLTAATLALATPASALNPQPLPPGMRYRPVVTNHDGAMQANRGSYALRCHGVQVGDPRKQPPMRVCP